MASSRASWPLGRGFDRWYGFHGGETHQFVPALYHDNHAVHPPASIRDGYHLSADLADRAIEFSRRPARGRCRASVLLLPRDRRVPLAAPAHPSSGSSTTAAISTGVGRVAGGDLRASARERLLRPAPRCRRVRIGCPRGMSSVPMTRRSPRGSWSASPRYSLYTDAQLGRVLDVPRRDRRRSTTPSSSCCARTTAPAPRAVARARSTTCVLYNARSGRHDVRCVRRIDELGGPTHAQQLSVGLDDGRQHAVQAMEARGARRRRGRSLHRPAGRTAARGRRGHDAAPVRARHRRTADRARADRRGCAR